MCDSLPYTHCVPFFFLKGFLNLFLVFVPRTKEISGLFLLLSFCFSFFLLLSPPFFIHLWKKTNKTTMEMDGLDLSPFFPLFPSPFSPSILFFFPFSLLFPFHKKKKKKKKNNNNNNNNNTNRGFRTIGGV